MYPIRSPNEQTFVFVAEKMAATPARHKAVPSEPINSNPLRPTQSMIAIAAS
jgi:hypothetical protein